MGFDQTFSSIQDHHVALTGISESRSVWGGRRQGVCDMKVEAAAFLFFCALYPSVYATLG